MIIVAGLGNKNYKGTRHNIGADIIETITATDLGYFSLDGKDIFIINSPSFMNSSGTDIKKIVNSKKIKYHQLIVICDDIDLPFGKIKIKYSGGSRGHNGIRNIIENFGSNFWRILIGVGRPNNKEEVRDFVLEFFTIEEKEKMNSIKEVTLDNIRKIINNEMDNYIRE